MILLLLALIFIGATTASEGVESSNRYEYCEHVVELKNTGGGKINGTSVYYLSSHDPLYRTWNELGDKRWEMVSIYTTSTHKSFVFKREK